MAYKVFIIAGESSGDVLGASLIKAMKARYPDLELRGIGGPAMLDAGLPESLFPMDRLSVMGIAEILPKIPLFMRLISKTVQAIRNYNPDLVVTIDSPDFSFRVQKKLKAYGVAARKVHYVAPTVWAWRSGRALKISTFLDGIMCLFPFEPDYFEREGLKASFVGHPMVESGLLQADGNRFREAHNIPQSAKTLGLFCGSRNGEITTSVPVMREMLERLRKKDEHIIAIIPTLPKWQARLEREFADLGNVVVTSDDSEKYDAFRACTAAILVSGTIALELALLGVPHILFYRMNRLTWAIIRRVVKTRFAHLGNILLKRGAYREFIQERADPDQMEEVLGAMLANPVRQDEFRKLADELLDTLRPNPNEKAADMAAEFALR